MAGSGCRPGQIDNGHHTTDLWYRLTNGLFVSDAWLDIGTNDPIPGVQRWGRRSAWRDRGP